MKLLRALHRKLGLKYQLDRSRRYVRRFGLRAALETHRRIWSAGGEIEIQIPGLPHGVTIRAGSADAGTLEKVFVWDDYDLDYPPEVRTIVDAGANIGLSAVFFASRFPGATIIAVEPERGNFELLRRNSRRYTNVIPLNAALWSEDRTLWLDDPGERVDSYRFGTEVSGDPVEALGLPSILARFGTESVDVLKIDIEGGETALFRSPGEWLRRVRMFVVELHGAEARAVFEAATACLRAERYRRGENDVLVVRP